MPLISCLSLLCALITGETEGSSYKGDGCTSEFFFQWSFFFEQELKVYDLKGPDRFRMFKPSNLPFCSGYFLILLLLKLELQRLID